MPAGARRWSGRRKGSPARQRNSSLLVSARQLQALVRPHTVECSRVGISENGASSSGIRPTSPLKEILLVRLVPRDRDEFPTIDSEAVEDPHKQRSTPRDEGIVLVVAWRILGLMSELRIHDDRAVPGTPERGPSADEQQARVLPCIALR